MVGHQNAILALQRPKGKKNWSQKRGIYVLVTTNNEKLVTKAAESRFGDHPLYR